MKSCSDTLAKFQKYAIPQLLRKPGRRLLNRWRCRRLLQWFKARRPEIYARIARPDLPESVRRLVLERLSAESYYNQDIWSNSRDCIATDVLYVSHNASPDGIKDVIALKRVEPRLHCTLLVRTVHQHESLARQYFDRVEFYQSGVELISCLLTARARALILRGTPAFEGTLTRLFFDGRLINRTSDLNWGFTDYDPNSVRALVEKYLWEHAEGIFHIYSSKANEILHRYMNIQCPVVSIRPQCVPELGPFRRLRKLSVDDGEVHLVAVNTVAHRHNGRPIKPRWGSANDMIGLWRTIVAQKLHIHYYIPYQSQDVLHGYGEYLELAGNSPYFHIEQSLPFDKLLIELTRYDWGLNGTYWQRSSPPLELSESGPNNLFTFIQAGLPIICYPKHLFPEQIIEKYGNGLVIKEGDIPNLRVRLEGYPKGELEKRAQRVREELVYDYMALYELVFGRRPGLNDVDLQMSNKIRTVQKFMAKRSS